MCVRFHEEIKWDYDLLNSKMFVSILRTDFSYDQFTIRSRWLIDRLNRLPVFDLCSHFPQLNVPRLQEFKLTCNHRGDPLLQPKWVRVLVSHHRWSAIGWASTRFDWNTSKNKNKIVLHTDIIQYYVCRHRIILCHTLVWVYDKHSCKNRHSTGNSV